MMPYLAILSARARLLFQYRAAALAGLVTQLFWGYMKVMVLTAFYANATAPVPISLVDAITYTWLSQALLSQLPWNIDREIEQMVRSGNVVYELIRPLRLYPFWFCRALAMRVVPLTLKGIPLFLIILLCFDLETPETMTQIGWFITSMCGGILLSTSFTVLVMISLFWTVTGEGILRLLPAIMLVFTGMLVPLPLFPDWFQPILDVLPFRGIIDTPLRIYTGSIDLNETPWLILHQWIWITILILFGQWLLERAGKRIAINGG
jgi:ABC-2 type transport system permease protein